MNLWEILGVSVLDAHRLTEKDLALAKAIVRARLEADAK